MAMHYPKTTSILLGICLLIISCRGKESVDSTASDTYRPKFHYTPEANWMNDPNGLVLYNDTYHLFYQYYPDSNVWGPMHWGHATSRDLVHWQEQPIALYPDSLGYIFSGSVVVDSMNTSGFGKNGIIPLVAVFTHHLDKGERAGRNDFQYQSLAYSLDSGSTWKKYEGNPVLKNPGIRDFRDPNVCWYAPGKKWIMSLATNDRVSFYSSLNLKDWQKESEFGEKEGAHGGVWECPDLFYFNGNGKEIWVLTVSINPGGPNGGSATQYFTGYFDGNKFTPDHSNTKWIDYGTDNYAGVTWHNTGPRKIFLGWMSNWDYAQAVPTKAWRSAMTLPRDVSLASIDNQHYLRLAPVFELSALRENPVDLKNISVKGEYDLGSALGKTSNRFVITLKASGNEDFSVRLYNDKKEEILIGYDTAAGNYFIDRVRSGNTVFNTKFSKKMTAPRLSKSVGLDMTLVVDESSVELFADDGLTNMTSIFFAEDGYTRLSLSSAKGIIIDSLNYASLKSSR